MHKHAPSTWESTQDKIQTYICYISRETLFSINVVCGQMKGYIKDIAIINGFIITWTLHQTIICYNKVKLVVG